MFHHPHSRHDSRSPFHHHHHAHAPAAAAAETEHRREDGARQGMDPPSSSGRPTPTTPRRQLQGPRPPRLNVRMESHAIRKPSAASGVPPPGGQGTNRREPHHQQPPPQQQQQPGRAPVIIYDASPKVIHAKPSEFMALVQRLTGPGSGAAGSATTTQPPHDARHAVVDVDGDGDDDLLVLGQAFLPPELLLSPSAAMSPAARLATIERSVRPAPATGYDGHLHASSGGDDDGTLAAVLGPARHPSILSPLPSSLPPAAASGLFSPLPFDASTISWLNELSPILRAASTANASSSGGAFGFGGAGPGGAATTNGGGGSRPPPPPAYYSDPFVPSPRNLLATPTVPSPATCAEFFGSLPDL